MEESSPATLSWRKGNGPSLDVSLAHRADCPRNTDPGEGIDVR